MLHSDFQSFPEILAEYRDDSHIIPRSSSVVVKRVFAKPGKGKAAMYIAGTATASSSGTPEQGKQPAAGANGSHSWHRGNISKRFDGKEESSTSASKATTPAPVSFPSLRQLIRTVSSGHAQVAIKPSNITGGDEAAAMAAMFQAQTANWEETQEKMSQLVSRSAIFVLRSTYRPNEHSRFASCSAATLEPLVSTRTRAVEDQEVVEASPSITSISIAHFPLAMSVIVVDRKVCILQSCFS
jgi:hypothetical protein